MGLVSNALILPRMAGMEFCLLTLLLSSSALGPRKLGMFSLPFILS
jgi:hypothetical protein